MKIFVTGATGLVGSATVRQLLSDGHTVSALFRPGSDRSLLKDIEQQITWLEGDILDIQSLEKAMENIDYVVHAAAIVSFVPRDSATMFKVNIEGTANVINACLKSAVGKLCHVSSVAALGRPTTRLMSGAEIIGIDENQRWEDSPHNSHYARSKYLAELEVWRGIAEGLSAVIVNPSLILGEGDWQKSSTQLFKYVYNENSFYTEGTVNYVDVQDLSRAISALLKSDITAERFILSAGTVSYQKLFATMAKAFGKRSPSLKVGKRLASVIWRAEAIRSWLTGSKPLITKETARSATNHFEFKNSKIKSALHFEYRPLEVTIHRVCESFLNKD